MRENINPCYLASALEDLEVDKEPTYPPIQEGPGHVSKNDSHAKEESTLERAHITWKNGCCSDWSAVGLFNGSHEHNCYRKSTWSIKIIKMQQNKSLVQD